jgi:UDP-N-acetylglucosamine transferase subunit ALG13
LHRILGQHSLIFVTVGTQLPFPRLVDEMCRIRFELNEEIIIQSVNTTYSDAKLTVRPFLAPVEFEKFATSTRIIVGHAGIGTLLTAKKCRVPLVVLPRKASLGEHRNDHQVATAHQISNITGVYVAQCETDLLFYLRRNDLEECTTSISIEKVKFLERLSHELARRRK